METCYLLVFCLGLTACSGFLFRADVQANAEGRAIESSCLELADQGSCNFYTCFENRLPCGRNWYILRTGHYYCNKMQRRKQHFSQAGQRFIDNAQKCLTQALKDKYRSDELDCHSLEHHAVNSVTPCFTANGFCSILSEDSDELFSLFDFSDLFTRGAGKLWRELVSLAATCARERINDVVANAEAAISDTIEEI